VGGERLLPRHRTRGKQRPVADRFLANGALANAEARLCRHQAAIEAGVDPAAIVDAINQARPNALPPKSSSADHELHWN
jgi:hypothetical protein